MKLVKLEFNESLSENVKVYELDDGQFKVVIGNVVETLHESRNQAVSYAKSITLLTE